MATPQEDTGQQKDTEGKSRSFWVGATESEYRKVQILAALRGSRGTNAIAAEAFRNGLAEMTKDLESQIAEFLLVEEPEETGTSGEAQ